MASHYRIFVSTCCLLVSQLISTPVFANLQQFQSSWEASEWVVDATQKQCSLTHDIPRFGRARFEQSSGKRLKFSLLVDQPPVRDQTAHIRSELPPWKFEGTQRDLGGFDLQQGKTPLIIPRDQALRLYYELEQGMQPVIEFEDWGDGQDRVLVTLMPVRFREALPKFLECTAGLLYLDFEPRAEKRVFFSTNSSSLNRQTRRVLEEVARDYRKKKDFRIVLGGHADERGDSEFNMVLSRQRAAMVSRYLRSRGVPSKVIESRFFGEAQPEAVESNKAAWAKNRRVTVWIADHHR
jgi:outer membrane protein OmpA-like peptidoglycan-associated protein